MIKARTTVTPLPWPSSTDSGDFGVPWGTMTHCLFILFTFHVNRMQSCVSFVYFAILHLGSLSRAIKFPICYFLFPLLLSIQKFSLFLFKWVWHQRNVEELIFNNNHNLFTYHLSFGYNGMFTIVLNVLHNNFPLKI